jgi:hypothetical protein
MGNKPQYSVKCRMEREKEPTTASKKKGKRREETSSQ